MVPLFSISHSTGIKWPGTPLSDHLWQKMRMSYQVLGCSCLNFTVSLLKLLLLPSKLFFPLKIIISVFLVTLSRQNLEIFCSSATVRTLCHFGYSRMHNNFSTKENACYSCGCSRVQAWCHPEWSNFVLRTGFLKLSRPHAAVVALWLTHAMWFSRLLSSTLLVSWKLPLCS